MPKWRVFFIGLGIAMSLHPVWAVSGLGPDALVRKVVDTERAANKADHSKWTYMEDLHKPKDHVTQWVAATQQGDVQRVMTRNEQALGEAEQQGLIQKFMHDPKAQKKQVEENDHDAQQVDDLLKLLPEAFHWTQTGTRETEAVLHFEPNPDFHPPTREARVFGAMAGDLVVDDRQYRIKKMTGHLIHDVTFGAGLLGRLKQGSWFSLKQAEVAEGSWELTEIGVHLDGNALLFKSISLQQDDERSQFSPEPANITLEQAAAQVMKEPEVAALK